jgi:poly-gamma-glutamate capsule biosynthesis protein CapA/YwtB (metallophosphatase superfamily)
MQRAKFLRIISPFIIAGAVTYVYAQKNPPEIKSEVTIKQEQTNQSEESTVTLAAIGDILIHDSIYNDAKQADGTYDFHPMFEAVKPLLEQADITIANQESMIGGSEIGISSYPSFNSPYEVGDAMKDAGIDIVSLANNHTLDRGEKAIRNALSHWEELQVLSIGSHKSFQDTEKIPTLQKKGITFSFLSYTYGTNGINVPKGKEYLVDYIDETKMKYDIKRAKGQSDVVVASLHFGTEYEKLPNKEQQKLAQFLADEGVHIILGSHAHVLQPPAFLTGKNGNKTYTAYSMGNFLAAQAKGMHDRYTGGIFNISVTKKKVDGKQTIELSDSSFIPTYITQDQGKHYRIRPLNHITKKELPQKERIFSYLKEHMVQYMKELRIE